MTKFLPLFLAVLLAVVMVVPASAVSHNGIELPDFTSLWDRDSYPYAYISYSSSLGRYMFYASPDPFVFSGDGFYYSGIQILKLDEGASEWKGFGSSDSGTVTKYQYIWSSYDLYYKGTLLVEGQKCDGSTCPATDANKDNICDDCGMPFSVPRDYSPFTVKMFMNHIGQILTSAVSWVSDVGAAILADPLLLAFTALPLCGLGIAVFRRLKETV